MAEPVIKNDSYQIAVVSTIMVILFYFQQHGETSHTSTTMDQSVKEFIKKTSGHPHIQILTQWIIPFGIRCQRKYTKDTQKCLINVNSE